MLRSSRALLATLRSSTALASNSAPASSLAASAGAKQGSEQDGFYKAGFALGAASAAAMTASTVAFASGEAEHGMHCPQYPWPHEGIFSSYDHSAIRRGHQVYHYKSKKGQ